MEKHISKKNDFPFDILFCELYALYMTIFKQQPKAVKELETKSYEFELASA